MIRRTLESRWLFAVNIATVAVLVCGTALPVLVSLASLAQRPPACPWRISTAGVIHGPESPYRAMTPPSRCYATEAAARAALQEGNR